MDAVLVESLEAFAAELDTKELMQKSNEQFTEDQIVQMTIKESMKELAPMQEERQDKFEDEEEMLRKALEMSQKEGDAQENNNNAIEEITNLAYQYGFNQEQAIEGISVVGTGNPDLVINYLMSVYGGYASSLD